MSAKPVSRTINYAPNAPAIESLSVSEKKAMYAHGYKKADIEAMTYADAQQILKLHTPKAGSTAAMKEIVNPLTGEKGVEDLVGRWSDEEIAKRNAERPDPSGIQVVGDEFTRACVKASQEKFIVKDEYTQRIVKGADPFNAILREYADANPGKRFRFENPDLPVVETGPAYQPVSDEEGKRVTVAGMVLGWMPESVHYEAYEKPNLERSNAMTARIQRNQEDADIALNPKDAHYAPIPASQRGPDGTVHPVGVVEATRSNAYHE